MHFLAITDMLKFKLELSMVVVLSADQMDYEVYACYMQVLTIIHLRVRLVIDS